MFIHDMKDVGWEKVCDVRTTYYGNYWYYVNINKDIMFSPHQSWIYAITDNEQIVKIGESGNPLGIRYKRFDSNFPESQPQIGTKCRLGRYRKNGDSDQTIREYLRREAANNQIAIYAYKCPNFEIPISIGGKEKIVQSTIHKHLEKVILDFIAEKDGRYPWLNCGRY